MWIGAAKPKWLEIIFPLKKNFVAQIQAVLNPNGYKIKQLVKNCTASLLNGWILPICGFALRRVSDQRGYPIQFLFRIKMLFFSIKIFQFVHGLGRTGLCPEGDYKNPILLSHSQEVFNRPVVAGVVLQAPLIDSLTHPL